MLATYQALKERQRALRSHGLPASLNLRVHRALSWLHRAAQCDDEDGRFVFLWIAFNAAYAQEIPQSLRLSQQETFREFLGKLHRLDHEKKLNALVWQEFSGPIRILLNNPYVFESFWDYHRGTLSQAQWEAKLARGKQKAAELLAQGDTPQLLGLVFQRIYTLRNQVLHGGATWNSQVNRAQLKDCVNLMGKLVPVVIDLMLSSPDTLWGEACYPVVD